MQLYTTICFHRLLYIYAKKRAGSPRFDFDSSFRFWRESESSGEQYKCAATLRKSGNTQPIKARERERESERVRERES